MPNPTYKSSYSQYVCTYCSSGHAAAACIHKLKPFFDTRQALIERRRVLDEKIAAIDDSIETLIRANSREI